MGGRPQSAPLLCGNFSRVIAFDVGLRGFSAAQSPLWGLRLFPGVRSAFNGPSGLNTRSAQLIPEDAFGTIPRTRRESGARRFDATFSRMFGEGNGAEGNNSKPGRRG